MGRTRELADVEALVEEATAALAEIRFEECLIDAHEIHEYLTAAIRADWADIENDDGTFKPISEWPPIWRQMKEAGDVEVEYESHRSHDGEDRDGRGGWDSDGIVRKVKLKFTSRVKLIELAMKHKAVDAIVQPHTDVNLNVNITATEQRLERAKLRMQRVIDVKAKEIKE